MKEKDITLLSGNEGKERWAILLIVKRDGKIQSRGHFVFQPTKRKTITLFSGNEDGRYWNIFTNIDTKGNFIIRSGIRLDGVKNKENQRLYHRNYLRGYRKIKPTKSIFLGLYSEDGYSLTLSQEVSSKGKVYGIGSFQVTMTPSKMKKINVAHRERNLILLNTIFPNSELHHLSEIYGIYIPRDLHRSVSHNLKIGKNMEKINDRALEYGDLNINKNKEANYFK